MGRYTLPMFTGCIDHPWTRPVETGRLHGPCSWAPVSLSSYLTVFFFGNRQKFDWSWTPNSHLRTYTGTCIVVKHVTSRLNFCSFTAIVIYDHTFSKTVCWRSLRVTEVDDINNITDQCLLQANGENGCLKHASFADSRNSSMVSYPKGRQKLIWWSSCI